MDASHSLETGLAAVWPPGDWQDVTVLLAVSGGADSTALLRGMANVRGDGEGRLCVAHFNHRLRTPDSDADEAFTVELARRLGLPCEVGRAAAGQVADQTRNGLEAAARAARYRFLREAAERLGARYVATAHTADDQIETILHRVIRGTGIGGLAGMARARPLGGSATLIRPLLPFRRAELVAYLRHLGQPYRTDPSNQDAQWTRNRIRHELLPLLQERFNPAVGEAILRLGTLAGEVQAMVEKEIAELAEQHVVTYPTGGVQIDTRNLAERPAYVVRELLIAVWRGQRWPRQSMGFAEWTALAAMATGSAVETRTFPGNIRAEVERGRLVLRGQRRADEQEDC